MRVPRYEIIPETPDGKKYRLLEPIKYYCKRYDKYISLSVGYLSDGATGAFDIHSLSWWVHDKITDTGKFDDGSLCNNRQASTILADILFNEKRWFRSVYWWWATWLIGGKEARKNGMW